MNITLEWLMSQPFEIVGNGRETRFNCPNCDDTTKHLYVNADRSLWYCFKCGKGGKVHYQKLEPNLENFKHSKDIFGAKEFSGGVAEVSAINKLVKSLPTNYLIRNIAKGTPGGYLKSRGIYEDEIVKYSIRASLEPYGPYKNSIIFPVYSYGEDKVLDYFVCRKYDNSKPKYVNAPWPKGDTLFIASPDLRIDAMSNGPNVIVEGIFDALAVARVGYRGIALLGKTATSQQLSKLAKINVQSIIYLDNDALSHAVQLKLQFDALGMYKTRLIRQEKDAADLYLDNPKYLKDLILHAR